MNGTGWRECAYRPCSHIFSPQGRPGDEQECCSRECARKLQWDKIASNRFSSKFAMFLEQPEVGDPDAVERAFWRVFGT